MRRTFAVASAVLLALVLAGCLAVQVPDANAVRVYAVPNLGRWYDFGFMLGIGGFSGGVFAGSRHRR